MLLCVPLALPVAAFGAQSAGTVTILEGWATLLRDTTGYQLLEGVRLASEDIIHTSEKAFVRIEFDEATRVDLGPQTRLLNAAAASSHPAKHPARIPIRPYVLSGIMKFSAAKSTAGDRGYMTPYFSLMTSNAVTVAHIGTAEAAVFLESGEATLIETGSTHPGAGQKLRAGDFYTRKSGQKGAIAARPSQGFLSTLPRGFLDTIPSRLGRFKDREAAAKRMEEISYTDAESWLKTSRNVRRPLVQRWRSRANDPAFRTALIANLKHHPEWDPILFPEKYKPKEEKAPAEALEGPAAQ